MYITQNEKAFVDDMNAELNPMLSLYANGINPVIYSAGCQLSKYIDSQMVVCSKELFKLAEHKAKIHLGNVTLVKDSDHSFYFK
jgi:hypothetical protein